MVKLNNLWSLIFWGSFVFLTASVTHFYGFWQGVLIGLISFLWITPVRWAQRLSFERPLPKWTTAEKIAYIEKYGLEGWCEKLRQLYYAGLLLSPGLYPLGPGFKINKRERLRRKVKPVIAEIGRVFRLLALKRISTPRKR